MTLAQLYWLITLPKLGSGAGVVLMMIGGIVSFGLGMFYIMDNTSSYQVVEWNSKIYKRIFVGGIVSFILGGLLQIFIPTTKEIVAIYGINYVTNEKSLNQIPPKLFELANIKLDDLLEETK